MKRSGAKIHTAICKRKAKPVTAVCKRKAKPVDASSLPPRNNKGKLNQILNTVLTLKRQGYRNSADIQNIKYNMKTLSSSVVLQANQTSDVRTKINVDKLYSTLDLDVVGDYAPFMERRVFTRK